MIQVEVQTVLPGVVYYIAEQVIFIKVVVVIVIIVIVVEGIHICIEVCVLRAAGKAAIITIMNIIIKVCSRMNEL